MSSYCFLFSIWGFPYFLLHFGAEISNWHTHLAFGFWSCWLLALVGFWLGFHLAFGLCVFGRWLNMYFVFVWLQVASVPCTHFCRNYVQYMFNID